MNDTYYQWHDVFPGNVAQGYFDLYNNNTIVNVSNLVIGSGNGYGGVYSNLFDMYKFGNALLWNQTLLQPSSLARMRQTGKTDGNNRMDMVFSNPILTWDRILAGDIKEDIWAIPQTFFISQPKECFKYIL